MIVIRKSKWYILVNDKVLGPYKLDELLLRNDITPFTKVKKKGDKQWQLAGTVFELRVLFTRTSSKPTFSKKNPPKEVLILPSNRLLFFLWFLLLFFIILYLIIGFYGRF